MKFVAKRREGKFDASTFSRADTSPILPVAYISMALQTRAAVKKANGRTPTPFQAKVFLGLRREETSKQERGKAGRGRR